MGTGVSAITLKRWALSPWVLLLPLGPWESLLALCTGNGWEAAGFFWEGAVLARRELAGGGSCWCLFHPPLSVPSPWGHSAAGCVVSLWLR